MRSAHISGSANLSRHPPSGLRTSYSADSTVPAQGRPDDDLIADAILDARLREQLRKSDALGERRSLDEKLVLQVSLGIGIDGGQPSGETLLSGASLDEGSNYSRLRSYGFGNATVGTNGLGTRSLRSYLASSYRFDQNTQAASTPIPTVYDGDFSDFVIRSAWIDLEDIFDSPALRPLYLRVGRQYKYLAAIAHFDGISGGYRTKNVTASAFIGSRANLYDLATPLGTLSGGELNIHLGRLGGVSWRLSASTLHTNQRTHTSGSIAARINRGTTVATKVRTIGSRLAAESIRIRSRVSVQTTATFELDNQHSRDWAYDFLLLESPSLSATTPRRYLDLGPPRPRIRAKLRGGTVLLRNIDFLASIAAAAVYSLNSDDKRDLAPSTRSTYLEAGTAIELRLRRNLRFGASITGRIFRRRGQRTTSNFDQMPDPLPSNTGLAGERTFVEAGTFLGYTLGARRFSAKAEFYGRRFRSRSPYIPIGSEQAELRSGGRFSVEGWANDHLRLSVAYDLSLAAIRQAPELDGIKSLRVSAEGAF